MERLTIKIPEKEKGVIDRHLGRNYIVKEGVGNTEIDNKLGAIEDLEEEIGLPLEFILTKVIGCKIYTIMQSPFRDRYVTIDRALKIGRNYDENIWEIGCWLITTDSCFWVLPSDFGKNWWLNRAEAEKALERMNNEAEEC